MSTVRQTTALQSVLAGLVIAARVFAESPQAPPGIEPIAPLVRTVDLSIGEAEDVRLCDGTIARVELIKVEEITDPIRNAIRQARVTVRVNDDERVLDSGNYRLPVVVGGAQIDCPVTKGYVAKSRKQNAWAIEKDARCRLWPADSPWTRPGTFTCPLRQRWLASATQMGNEPCFVDGSDFPTKTGVYYHYGLDFGGVERREAVVAAAEGLVVSAGGETLDEYRDGPVAPRDDVVYVVDGRGWCYRYSHLSKIDVKAGQLLPIGHPIGLMGKEGASGGWSHLHFHIASRQPSGEWGVQDAYPYVWEAYQRAHRPEVIAVARPHQLVLVGDEVVLDGSRSWSRAGKPVQYEWTFSDGTKAKGPTAKRTYASPGAYSEVLRVTSEGGRQAMDFAVVQVLDRRPKEPLPPTIHAAYYPTTEIKVGDEVAFVVRSFRTTEGAELWDFGDGSPPVKAKSDGNVKPHAAAGYALTTHRYQKPGMFLVQVQRTNSRGESATAHLCVDVADSF